ncbi:hypothetical protein PQX77_022207 [Marasmius sp. AFHP31]|nr:hypothetical protein PQX77_022207 [Marasmius sp. AFHP31]
MDGNNSLKMVDTEKRAGRARLDTRHLKHPRWLDAGTVDIFKDEVIHSHRLSRAKAAAPAPDNGDTSACDGPEFNQDVAWLDVNEVEGLEECADTCVEQWKAAGPDANKRMYSFFAISGIFLSVCRHGHVLVICDMRRSGELMKYPLAIVKELLDRYGHDIGLGYDIMCAFIKTLLRSPQLGNHVVACRLKGVVPAFHGHAHNRKCQVSWHPMYTEGVGLEDFEESRYTGTVDIFKDEVIHSHRLSRAKAAAPAPDNGDTSACDGPEFNQDVAWLDVNEVEGLEECADTCVERWKAAGPDANKRMYSFFAISGIFLSVCRHGHVLVICDMRRSGELMKYPLAIVKELLDRYGRDIGLGYDIMCTFIKTLLRSPQLGNHVVACRLKGVVPAFHGHAHNRKCQVSWHPMYTEGVGLEDFEECERTFSESNHLAATTRLATEFHRQQSILEHFDFHDVDKHVSSGNFIYQNYRQALDRIANDTPLFAELCEQYDLSGAGCELLLQEETKHLTREVEESPELAARLDYIEMLQKLSKHKGSSDEAQAKFKDAERSQRASRKQLTALQTRARTALDRYKMTLDGLLDFENDHSYFKRWDPTDSEYQQTVVAMRNRNYRQALDKLERLVVQRLLELTKLNISGVGYKQREKISQALRARAKAIQKALDAYNEAARAMEPPRQALDWKDILDMATVADFDLLKDTELDLTHVPWAQPGPRECMRLHFGLKRAHEEITRLNIEISRLITFMIDDHADHHYAISHTREAGDLDLAAELSYRMAVKSEINGHIAIRLVQTSELEGFSGTLIPGEREGRDPQLTDSAPLPSWASVVLGLTRNGDNFAVQGTQTDLSHLLSNLPGATAPVEVLLDYFEHCSIAISLLKPLLAKHPEKMQQDREEEYLCLRLQGKAERRWLRLRGVKNADMDGLIQMRQAARTETYERHSKIYQDKNRERNQLEKRIRYAEWRLKALLLKNGSEAERLARMKKTSEEALEDTRLAEDFSLGMVERLGQQTVAKRLVLRKRRTCKASPAVSAVVERKVSIVYANESL